MVSAGPGRPVQRHQHVVVELTGPQAWPGPEAEAGAGTGVGSRAADDRRDAYQGQNLPVTGHCSVQNGKECSHQLRFICLAQLNN